MEINTTLFRKEPRFDTRLCKVEKILELSGSDFVHLKENLLDEYKFLTRYRNLMRLDQDDIAHCLMVLGDGYEDGILIEQRAQRTIRKSIQRGAARAAPISTPDEPGENLLLQTESLPGRCRQQSLRKGIAGQKGACKTEKTDHNKSV